MTRSAFDEIRPDEYAVAHDAAQLGLLLINKLDSHAHLHGVEVGYLFRDDEIREKGRLVLGSAHTFPLIKGAGAKYWERLLELKIVELLGFQPYFLILLDVHAWAGLDARAKLALVDHELCHCAQAEDDEGNPRFNQVTGEPIWTIRGHDVEEFTEIAARHGAWKEDLVDFARALIDSLSNGPALKLPTDVREQAAR